MRRRFLILIAVLIMLCSISVSAYAHPLPDLDSNGSLTINMNYDGKPITGGEFTIYRVADITFDDGDCVFRLIEEIDPNRPIETNLWSWYHTLDLVGLVRYNPDVDSYTAPIVDGKAVFTDVKPGLYAVMQYYHADGFDSVPAFMISVPWFDGEQYIQDVVADPKTPIELGGPDETTNPTKPTTPGDKLPQTGQLNWPVPILAVAGLALFVFGWWMRFGKKKESYEE